ncbi:MAG TPA: transglutaminase domain-containing protein [Verrucomicrobiae bacterium]|nr:transglutaminase domain-containing protein [Verrucomicrobiae bacterium]
MNGETPVSETPAVKTPPLLLLAALLFWGWQSGLLWAGAAMGLILESSRLIKTRWDFTEKEFRRIFTFCIVLSLAAAVYAFTSNEEGSFSQMFSGPAAFHNATLTGVRASSAFFRWLPMTLFLVAATQLFGARERIPWTAISVFARRMAAREKMIAGVNVTYPYFIICVFSAGIHANAGDDSFFWGQCILVGWALWPVRSRRFWLPVWLAAVALVVVLGFFSQRGVGDLVRILENYNGQWIARFLRQRADPMQSITAIGHIGELKLSGQIVIRLHTENGAPPPLYLREASYRIYHPAKRSWYAGSARTDFIGISPQTNQTSWVLLERTNADSLNIACYLNGRNVQSGNAMDLLPLPSGSGRLDNLYAFTLQKNPEGAVLAEGPGLVIFDARYGPGQTMDSPPAFSGADTNLDLFVPAEEMPALDKVISGLNISAADEEQKLRAVARFFGNNFTYSVWQPKAKSSNTNLTPLADFLLNSRSGHCEYFASATVLLLRELKIPARYAVGFYVHEKSGRGYVVRERDAHAWCLVWNGKTKTWDDFDTTPASWVAEEGKRASVTQWLSDLRSWMAFQIAKFRWGQTNLRKYILWGLIPVLILLLLQIVFSRGRQRRRQNRISKKSAPIFWPGLDSEFYRLEKKLVACGFPRQSGEPMSAWLKRAGDETALAPLREPLLQLLKLHYRHRFDPRGLDETERETLRREVEKYLSVF